MRTVPLDASPSQRATVMLDGQSCRIEVYQKVPGLFMDLYMNDALVIGGVLCHDRNRIVRDAYLGFVGDLVFVDMEGADDPVYSGIGTRWLLFYLTTAEL